MKTSVLLILLLAVLPAWLFELSKDKLVVFASLSYYKCDFDGDRKEDLSVWDPKTNTLYFELTSDKKSYQKKFIDNELKYEPVFADYDGDGRTDFVFYQKDTGQWISFLTTKKGPPEKTFFGSIGDLPIPVRSDAGGKFNLAIWRPNASAWLITHPGDGNKNPEIVFEGNYQDSTFSGDYDGDGKSDLIVWRPDDGQWHIVRSGTNFDFNQSEHIQHGKEWDVIVPNDYDGDRKCDLVFWRPEDKKWYFFYAGSKSYDQIRFGETGDIPASGDLDGDGIPELIMWNPDKKSWNVLNLKKQETLSYKWNVPNGCVPAISVLEKYE